MKKLISILCLVACCGAFCNHIAMSQCYFHPLINAECPGCAANECLDAGDEDMIELSLHSIIHKNTTKFASVLKCADPLLGISSFVWQPPE